MGGWLDEARRGAAGVSAVVAALGDAPEGDSARLAALALARVEAHDALAQLLAHPTRVVRVAAIDALRTARSTKAGSVLLSGLQGEPEPWLRRRRAEAGLAIGGAPELAWKAEDWGVRAAVLAYLQGRSVDDSWWPSVEPCAESTDAEAAWRACALLADRTEDAPAALFDAALDHDSAFVVAQAARALVLRGLAPPADVPGLYRDDVPLDLEGLRALDDADAEDLDRAACALMLATDEHALIAAIGRLARGEEERWTRALAQACAHPAPRVRAAAVRGLDGKNSPAVWAAYDDRVRRDPDPDQRSAVVWTVGRRRELEGLTWLVRWWELPAAGVRVAVVEALAARVRKTSRARTTEVRAVLDAAVASGLESVSGPAAEALARFPDVR